MRPSLNQVTLLKRYSNISNPTQRIPYLSSYNKYRLTKNHMTIPKLQNDTTPIYKPIVWIDCEMTGLDHTTDRIIEICCMITDGNFNLVDPNGYETFIHYSKDILDNMNEWCRKQHSASGITSKILASSTTRERAENELISYIKKYIPTPNIGVLAGNSVHIDRLFMLKDFPQVIDHLFYRIIDVSSIMEVCIRHNPDLAKTQPRKKKSHTAKNDILESIEQLKWYQTHYLRGPENTLIPVDQKGDMTTMDTT